ncbi:MAG: hypothetical protein ACE5HW_03395 [Candidatus Methanofastidiosia archaeon]
MPKQFFKGIKIGSVHSIFKRFFVVRMDKNFKGVVGHTIFNRKEKKIGRILEIFGPFRKPYLKVLKFQEVSMREHVYI